jgi:hypothetical protein
MSVKKKKSLEVEFLGGFWDFLGVFWGFLGGFFYYKPWPSLIFVLLYLDR